MVQKRKISTAEEIASNAFFGIYGSAESPNKIHRNQAEQSSTDTSSSSSLKGESFEEKQANLQSEYIQRSNLATNALLDLSMNEVDKIDIRKEDFAASDLSFNSILKAIHYSGPEHQAYSAHGTIPITTVEGLITIAKVTELFIMDMALKSWNAKDLEPEQLNFANIGDAHNITYRDMQRAVCSHDELDFLSEIVHREPTTAFYNTFHYGQYKPKTGSIDVDNEFLTPPELIRHTELTTQLNSFKRDAASSQDNALNANSTAQTQTHTIKSSTSKSSSNTNKDKNRVKRAYTKRKIK